MVCKQSSPPLICCHLFIGVNIRQSAEKKKGTNPFSIALLHIIYAKADVNMAKVRYKGIRKTALGFSAKRLLRLSPQL